jgi:hypothetical protein
MLSLRLLTKYPERAEDSMAKASTLARWIIAVHFAEQLFAAIPESKTLSFKI